MFLAGERSSTRPESISESSTQQADPRARLVQRLSGTQFNDDMIRVVSWNTGGRAWWNVCDQDVDVVLLQEARRPPSAPNFEMVPSIDDEWRTAGSGRRDWSTVIAAPS
jgi:hypothetical protein